MEPPLAVRRLSAGELPPITLFQAPRGYGKTVAASWLLRQRQDLYVWVNLPMSRVTGEQLWRTVRQRLRDAGLETEDWSELDRLLARRSRRLVIAIDDLHRIVDTDVDEQLAWLASHHEQIHVVAMSRQPRVLSVLVTQMDGVILGADDLRLNPEQTRRLAAGFGHELTAPAAADLAVKLWGCPALLRSVLAGPLRETFGAVEVDPAKIDRIIRLLMSDYADPAVRATLLMLAVPASLPDDLALELVGPAGVQVAVDAIADSGAAAIRSPAGETLIPEPIRAAMCRLLRQDDLERFQEASLRVAHWFESYGEAGLALKHAVDAQAWQLVADLLTRHWALLLVEQPSQVRAALQGLPADLINRNVAQLVARDYVVNVLTDRRARAAYNAGLLLPGALTPADTGSRLVARPVLSLETTGLYDSARHLLGSKSLSEAVASGTWSATLIAAIPQQLVQWSTSLLLGNPGVVSIYGFAEAAAWAERLRTPTLQRTAAAGAALTHAVAGNPRAARRWLDVMAGLPLDEQGSMGAFVGPLTERLIAQERLQAPIDDLDPHVPPDLPDLEVLVVQLNAQELVAAGRAREAVRLLEAYRVRNPDTSVANLVEHALVTSLCEAYLAAGLVERARKLLVEADPGQAKHPATWMLLEFQSAEYERVLRSEVPGELLPRQTLQIWLLRACAALRLQQRAIAVDAFQTAISIATQTGLLRPFMLIPAADLDELGSGDGQLRELMTGIGLSALLAEPQHGGRLSPRELQVLEVVATGASFAAVASRLFVSPNTVKSQMRDVYRKLGVRGRDAAVERARELGLLGRVAGGNGAVGATSLDAV